jgi:hypothetical protein
MGMIITENAAESIDFVIVPGDLTKEGKSDFCRFGTILIKLAFTDI